MRRHHRWPTRKPPFVTDRLGSIFAGCRRSRVRLAERQVRRSKSGASRPTLTFKILNRPPDRNVTKLRDRYSLAARRLEVAVYWAMPFSRKKSFN
jgi:hypothetical protein